MTALSRSGQSKRALFNAEAARRMHEQQKDGPAGEAKAASPRGIYGEATDAEAEALLEDGIEVARIPWVPRSDG